MGVRMKRRERKCGKRDEEREKAKEGVGE